MYLRVFNFLWRAKRMEYTLSAIWKNQNHNTRLLRALTGSDATGINYHLLIETTFNQAFDYALL